MSCHLTVAKAPSLVSGIYASEREGEMYKQVPWSEWTEFAIPPQDQDAEFCRKMRAAILSGREVCPIGVNTQPCTEKPIVADGWKAPCVRVS